MPALYRDALPFRHVTGVGYVTHDMANLIHKFGLKGSCAEVVRVLKEIKVEEHFKSERLRAELAVKIMQLQAQVPPLLMQSKVAADNGWVPCLSAAGPPPI